MPGRVEIPDPTVGEPTLATLLPEQLGKPGGGIGDDQVAVGGIARFRRALRGDGREAGDRLEAGPLVPGAGVVDFFGVLDGERGEAIAAGLRFGALAVHRTHPVWVPPITWRGTITKYSAGNARLMVAK